MKYFEIILLNAANGKAKSPAVFERETAGPVRRMYGFASCICLLDCYLQRFDAQAALLLNSEVFEIALFKRNPFVQKTLEHLGAVAQKNPVCL